MMGKTLRVAALCALALAVAGCQSARFGGSGTRVAVAPEPLPPAPTGPVSQEPLPPPSQPGAFPEAPETPEDETQTAAANPAATAPDITKNALVGSWTTSAGGTVCQAFLTLTKYGNASRGGTRGCPGQLADMRGWDVKGKQLVLYDDSGNTIARLYSSGGERLDGQTTAGEPVSLYR